VAIICEPKNYCRIERKMTLTIPLTWYITTFLLLPFFSQYSTLNTFWPVLSLSKMQFFPSGGNSEFSTKTENHPYMFCSMNHQIKNYPQIRFYKKSLRRVKPWRWEIQL
jgi:hypothetical protein